MGNNALLLLMGATNPTRVTKQTIGKQGRIGFGGGIYGGDSSDLTAIGLSPLPNNDDPTNENYGSYVHAYGSIMLFIPAFCYRIGNPDAPSYSRDGDNALEIRDARHGEGDGWILHRAFIDGGQEKSGFFIDKYLCSKDSTGKLAISVKSGNPICLDDKYNPSSTMPNCEGLAYDAITLSAARGSAYACVSAFQWSAIAMLSLAHGQAARSTKECAWFDPKYLTNFPKGNNAWLKDVNDPATTFAWASDNYGKTSLTGGASVLAKTTHTGQIWGITDINGNKYQPLIGWRNPSDNQIMLAKESILMHSFTKDNRTDVSMFDTVSIDVVDGEYYWGAEAFYKDTSGPRRAMCGVHPQTYHSSSSTSLFGNDYFTLSPGSEKVLLVSGYYANESNAGVWFRHGYRARWIWSDWYNGFRAAGYAK